MDKDIIIDGLINRIMCVRRAAEEYADQFFAWTPDEVIDDMDEYDAIDSIIEIIDETSEPV